MFVIFSKNYFETGFFKNPVGQANKVRKFDSK